jgi:hypothetical protein
MPNGLNPSTHVTTATTSGSIKSSEDRKQSALGNSRFQLTALNSVVVSNFATGTYYQNRLNGLRLDLPALGDPAQPQRTALLGCFGS